MRAACSTRCLWPGFLRHSQQTQDLTGAAMHTWGLGLQGTHAGPLCPALAALLAAAGHPWPCPASPPGPGAQPRPLPAPHLLDALHQRVLVEGHGLCTLVKMVLVAQAKLQHLLRVQLLQLGVGGGCLPTQESYKAKEGPELIHTISSVAIKETAEQTQQTRFMRVMKVVQNHLRMFWIYSSA